MWYKTNLGIGKNFKRGNSQRHPPSSNWNIQFIDIRFTWWIILAHDLQVIKSSTRISHQQAQNVNINIMHKMCQCSYKSCLDTILHINVQNVLMYLRFMWWAWIEHAIWHSPNWTIPTNHALWNWDKARSMKTQINYQEIAKVDKCRYHPIWLINSYY